MDIGVNYKNDGFLKGKVKRKRQIKYYFTTNTVTHLPERCWPLGDFLPEKGMQIIICQQNSEE